MGSMTQLTGFSRLGCVSVQRSLCFFDIIVVVYCCVIVFLFKKLTLCSILALLCNFFSQLFDLRTAIILMSNSWGWQIKITFRTEMSCVQQVIIVFVEIVSNFLLILSHFQLFQFFTSCQRTRAIRFLLYLSISCNLLLVLQLKRQSTIIY